ncbi:hypothetical protein [Patulibacter sp.]|uniref:hypothetical protein n=1 Tax=Patulibacter sp. TaxID=1912859 RepID=UPI00271A812B|nr:hypothetical protein [Patulibacter sp.]MDO9409706.1 hypothetical protein [Patulibacter sp.]
MSSVDDPRQSWPGAADVPGSGTVWVLRDPASAPPELQPYAAVTITAVHQGNESDDPESFGRGRELVLQPVEFGAPAIPAALDLFEQFYTPETASAGDDLDAAMDALQAVTG